VNHAIHNNSLLAPESLPKRFEADLLSPIIRHLSTGMRRDRNRRQYDMHHALYW